MDLPTATAPEDASRTRAELALRAAAPLRGSRKGRMLAQHDASDLDLFRAVDEPGLFAQPPAPPAPAAKPEPRPLPKTAEELIEQAIGCCSRCSSTGPAKGFTWLDETQELLCEACAAPPTDPEPFDYAAHEAERVERHTREMAVWQLERDRMGAIVEAEIAAAREHRLQWGAGRFGKAPYWTLQLVERDGEVFCREEMELHNQGSFGCWRSHGQTTIEAVKLELAGRRINDAACDIALGYEPTCDAQQAKLARWIIDQFPPLLSGVDFALQLERGVALYTERNKLRCAAIRAGEREYIDELGNTLIITSLGRQNHD